MHGLVHLLLKKLKLKDNLNFQKAEYKNLEALALSVIHIIFIVLFEYDPTNNMKHENNENLFLLDDWIKSMQSDLVNFNRNLFGW